MQSHQSFCLCLHPIKSLLCKIKIELNVSLRINIVVRIFSTPTSKGCKSPPPSICGFSKESHQVDILIVLWILRSLKLHKDKSCFSSKFVSPKMQCLIWYTNILFIILCKLNFQKNSKYKLLIAVPHKLGSLDSASQQRTFKIVTLLQYNYNWKKREWWKLAHILHGSDEDKKQT